MTAAYTPTVRNPSVAVVVAFPPLTEGELQEKLLGAKKYTGNSVYLRNLYSYSLESDDLVSEEGDG
jgi:hypothetical protein